MSRPGKNIRVWDKSTNPGFAEGKEFSVMTDPDRDFCALSEEKKIQVSDFLLETL